METNLIRLFAGHVVVSSEMAPAIKEELIQFVETATDYQLKTFLLDAEMVKDVDNDFARSILDSQFEISAMPIKINEFKKAMK